jgi:hypothetical protein
MDTCGGVGIGASRGLNEGLWAPVRTKEPELRSVLRPARGG